MKVATLLYSDKVFILEHNPEQLLASEANLVLGFGSSDLISSAETFTKIKERYPHSEIALCSSAGEIFGTEVVSNSVSLTEIHFDSSSLFTALVNIDQYDSSASAGKNLFRQLPSEGLKLVLVLSDGGKVNGSELVKGMNECNKNKVLITGGLAGDGTKFEKTFVGLNKLPEQGNIIAIGFYGDDITLSHGSLGGWESFGLERTVTRAEGNRLYEIDHKNALDLYKKYLGKYADELPGSALLFPLSIKLEEAEEPIVRTILSINEEQQSMTFAGDLPIGSKVRFMKANFDRLIDAASDAASLCLEMLNHQPKLAILISCVGRRIILGNRIDEEVEAVADILGTQTMLTGFYSYGEISPLKESTECQLHNQTMTITCINEINRP